MSYVGNSPTQQSFTGGVDQYNGNNSNTAFGLTRTINTVYDVDAYVENVWQRPTTGYTVSANTITFTSAPPAGSNNVVVVYRNFSATSIIPQQGSVVASSLSANLIPSVISGSALSGITTFAAGNTTITGFANVSTDAYIGGNVGIGISSSSASKLNVNYEASFLVDNNNRGIIGWYDSDKRLGFGTINASSAYFNAMSIKDGKIGIGKNAPVAPLHIYGTGTSGQSNAALIIENGSSGTLGIDITGTAGSSYARVRYGGGPSTGTNGMTGDVALIGLEGSSIGFQQIKFAPTQNASSDPNTLDDYEEGTWTPGISGRTFASVYGMYRKIGSCVYIYGDCNTINSALTDPTLTGLPFTTTNSVNTQYGGWASVPEIASWTLTAGYGYVYIRFYKNDTTGQFLQGSGATHNSGVAIGTNGNFRFSGFYFTS